MGDGLQVVCAPSRESSLYAACAIVTSKKGRSLDLFQLICSSRLGLFRWFYRVEKNAVHIRYGSCHNTQ